MVDSWEVYMKTDEVRNLHKFSKKLRFSQRTNAKTCRFITIVRLSALYLFISPLNIMVSISSVAYFLYNR